MELRSVCVSTGPIRFGKGSRIAKICEGDSLVTDNFFFHFYRPDKFGTATIFHNAEHLSDLLLPVLNED
jgi:hypothetical protein